MVKRRVLAGVFRCDNGKERTRVDAAIGNLKRLSVLRYSGMQTLPAGSSGQAFLTTTTGRPNKY